MNDSAALVTQLLEAIARADAALTAGHPHAAQAALDATECLLDAAPAEESPSLAIARARHHLARHRTALAAGAPDPRHTRAAVRSLEVVACQDDTSGAANALLAEAAVACCAGAGWLLRAQMIVVAQRAARKALARDSSHGEAHAALGLLALLAPGAPHVRATAARPHLEEAVRLQPGRVDWRAWLARACLDAGDGQGAERELGAVRALLQSAVAESLIRSVFGDREGGPPAPPSSEAAPAPPQCPPPQHLRPDQSPPAIAVRGAVRSFAGRAVLRGITLRVDAGEIVGLVGPNGAGKSTLLGAIAGRVALEAGEISVLGKSVVAGRMPEGLGYAPQSSGLYPLLSVIEHLRCFGRLHGLRGAALRAAVESALAWCGLENRSGDLARALSGGMRRRLALAIAAIHDPPVLLFDEPMTGIDATHRERIWAMIRERTARGVAIVCAAPCTEDLADRGDRLIELDSDPHPGATRSAQVSSGTASHTAASAITDEIKSAPQSGEPSLEKEAWR